MGITQINVGKLSSRSPKYPSESGFVADIRSQMKELEGLIQKVFDQVEGATPEIMLDSLQPTFVKAQVYCPKKTNRLVNSAYLEVTSFRGQPRVEMGFAKGGNPPYGVYVHEMVEHHHATPTRAKFLQAAMMEDLQLIFQRLVVRYKQLFGEK